ncbi:S41 family peptidase [Serratia surfactantfaciens]|uniref:S41 family peptidase n=1 Tax=Serratia surfactantfaciens TaxID=2741499 RepID=UPI003EDEB846
MLFISKVIIFMSLFTFAVLSQTATASLPGGAWSPNSTNGNYLIEEKKNNIQGESNISIRSKEDQSSGYGGALRSFDALSLRGKKVTFRVKLSVHHAQKGAAIWLRTDGVDGRLQFISTYDDLIKGNDNSQWREISLHVANHATKVVYGIVLSGSGNVLATDIRLIVNEDKLRFGYTPLQVFSQAAEIIKKDAVGKGNVDWDTVERNVKEKLDGEDDPALAYSFIHKLLKQLKDNHSSFIEPHLADVFYNSAHVTSQPIVKLIEGDVGYVKLPGFIGNNKEKSETFVKSISAQIKQVNHSVRKGWVLDLRESSGGNMWPILLSVKSLLGDKDIGGFKEVSTGEITEWHSLKEYKENGSSFTDLSSSKVAILLSSKTNSAGEAVAVAFHGRPGTRFFGGLTAGRASMNSQYKLVDGSLLNLTTSFDIDRKGNVFGGKISPDVFLESNEGMQDTVLSAAVNWLKER